MVPPPLTPVNLSSVTGQTFYALLGTSVCYKILVGSGGYIQQASWKPQHPETERGVGISFALSAQDISSSSAACSAAGFGLNYLVGSYSSTLGLTQVKGQTATDALTIWTGTRAR